VNWINNVVRPKIQGILKKKDVPENLWVKCPQSGQMVFYKDLVANQFVVPGSEYHMRMGALDRLKAIFDDGQFDPVSVGEVALDPLEFKDEKRYSDRLKSARDSTKLDDAVLVGEGRINEILVVIAAQDFKFMGGSLGMAAGQAIVTGMMRAIAKHAPFILFAASGGARMQEGILSLMQMPRTTVAVQQLREAGLPYVVVLTDPTTGGVTASYAMLGDIHIAEPGALICFAGPRVIEQTIREQLPDGFQRAEYLLEHGMIDMVVHRHEMRDTLSRVCRMLMGQPELRTDVVSKPEVKIDEENSAVNGHAVPDEVIAAVSSEVALKGDVPEAEPVDDIDKVDPSRFEASEQSEEIDGGAPDIIDAEDEEPSHDDAPE